MTLWAVVVAGVTLPGVATLAALATPGPVSRAMRHVIGALRASFGVSGRQLSVSIPIFAFLLSIALCALSLSDLARKRGAAVAAALGPHASYFSPAAHAPIPSELRAGIFRGERNVWISAAAAITWGAALALAARGTAEERERGLLTRAKEDLRIVHAD
jgi:hypothetical protein